MSKDRVRETTQTVGAGPYTTDGAVLGYQPFSSSFANGEAVPGLVVTDLLGNWEACDSVFTAPNQLSRGTFRGSNTGTTVIWGAGPKQIFFDLLAVRSEPLLNGTAGEITGGATGLTLNSLGGPVNINPNSVSALSITSSGIWTVNGSTASSATQFLSFTSSGVARLGVVVTTAASVVGARSVSSVAHMTSQAASTWAHNEMITLRGYYTENDGGGGPIVYSSSAANTVDNGMYFAPSSNIGRFIRQLADDTIYNVKEWGAKGDGTTDDTAAINACLKACTSAPIAASTPMAAMYFPAGVYQSDGIEVRYTVCHIYGDGGLNSRIRHISSNPANTKPVIYITGGSPLTAMPYGGVHDISAWGSPLTYPATVYLDTNIDIFANFNGLSTLGGGGTITHNGCDGFCFHDTLNFSINKFRNDSCTGYGMRVRGASCTTRLLNGTTNGLRATLNNTTGVFTVVAATAGKVPEQPPGCAVSFFTTTTLPTRTSLGAPIPGTLSNCYYQNWITEDTFTLHDSYADARASTNIIMFDDIGVGNLGFIPWQQNFHVTGVSSNVIAFENNKNQIIATCINDSTADVVYANGYVSSNAVNNALGVIFFAVEGGATSYALPPELSLNQEYYPIYQDAYHIKVASSVTAVSTGVGIALTSTFSNISILYDQRISALGMGTLIVRDWTYDNGSAATVETYQGIDCGGKGLLFGDWSYLENRGSVMIQGDRIEINKMPCRETIYSKNQRCMIRTEIGQTGRAGHPTVLLTVEDMMFDVSSALSSGADSPGDMIRMIGHRGLGELNPRIRTEVFNMGPIYDNDYFVAKTKIPSAGRSTKGRIDADGFANNSTYTTDFINYSQRNGVQMTPMASTNMNGGWSKKGDVLFPVDANAIAYKAQNASLGFSRSNAGVSIGATGTVTASTNVVTLSTYPDAQFMNGAAVTVFNGSSGTDDLSGIATNVELWAGLKQFQIVDETGVPILAATSAAGLTIQWQRAYYSMTPTFWHVSSAINFDSIPAGGGVNEKTIASPTGVSLRPGAPVFMGRPTIDSGVVVEAYVSATSTFTVRGTNTTTTGAINPGSIDIQALVMV